MYYGFVAHPVERASYDGRLVDPPCGGLGCPGPPRRPVRGAGSIADPRRQDETNLDREPLLMNSPPAVHPTDETLRSYGLGKLVDASSGSVSSHLQSCAVCQ